jgi:hypothetical protein
MFAAVKSRLAENPGWSEESVLAKLRLLAPTLERRSQRTARAWMEALRDS